MTDQDNAAMFDDVIVEEDSQPGRVQGRKPKTSQAVTAVEPIEPGSAHPMMARLTKVVSDRLNMGTEATVEWLDDTKFRMRLLDAIGLNEAQKACMDLKDSETAHTTQLAFEIVIRAITHVNGVEIEELAQTKSLNRKSIGNQRIALQTTHEKLRPWYESIITQDVLGVLFDTYSDMMQQDQQIREQVATGSKKK